jgi:riboflavin kinase/FMN adenylyltransferase
VVVRGDQRGRQLGFPTANLMSGQYAAVPADGIYAARVGWGHPGPPGSRPSGWRPCRWARTPPSPDGRGASRRTSWTSTGDIYGERLVIDFVARLREQRAYTELAPLIEQIDDDVAQTRSLSGSP